MRRPTIDLLPHLDTCCRDLRNTEPLVLRYLEDGTEFELLFGRLIDGVRVRGEALEGLKRTIREGE